MLTEETAQKIEISRLVGKGRPNQSASVVVPSVDQLSLLSENKPVLIILGLLTSERDVAADRILGVALERMAELFYESKEKSILKRMEGVAKSAQHILAELFFNAGFEKEPFRVTLDLGMLSIIDGVYSIYIDGDIRFWVVKGKKSVEISEVYAVEGEERLNGSGRWLEKDKLVMATKQVVKADWVVEQLKNSAVSTETVLKGLGELSSGEAIIVVGLKPEHEEISVPKEAIEKEEELKPVSRTGVESARKEDKMGKKTISIEWRPTKRSLVGLKTFFTTKFRSFKRPPFLKALSTRFRLKSAKDQEMETEKKIVAEEKGIDQTILGREESLEIPASSDKKPPEHSEGRILKETGKKNLLPSGVIHTLRDWAHSLSYLFSHIIGRIAIFGKRRRRIIRPNGTEKRQLIKGLVGLFVVFILCFLFWLFISKAFNARKNRENYNKQAVSIEAEIKWIEDHKSDASLTIDERLNRVHHARSLVDSIKSNPLSEQSKIDGWLARLQNVEDFLTKTIPITQLDVLSDLAILYSSANPVDIDVREDEVFVLDDATKKVYTVNLLTKNTEIYAECNDCNGLERIAWSQNHLFVYDSQKGLFEVLTDKTFKLVPGISTLGTSVTELSTYLDNVYFLIQEKRSIIKSIEIKGGYSVGQEYNKAPLPTGLEDMAIDGYIFVCTSAGEVKKYELGNEVPFYISGLRTPLGPKCSMDTFIPGGDEAKNYLYLLDSANKRIVVINKDDSNGNAFVAQMVYRGDPMWFKNLKEMVLTDDKKSVILLDGSAILRIDLTHLLNNPF